MSNAMQTFSFENKPIRNIMKDGEPWFVATDIADILEYRDAHNMVRMLDDDERGYSKVSTAGGEQEVTIINESGLYSCIFRSQKPEAKVFRKWITSEVIPSIRKTGAYGIRDYANSPTAILKETLKSISTMRTYGYDAEESSKIAFDAYTASTGLDVRLDTLHSDALELSKALGFAPPKRQFTLKKVLEQYPYSILDMAKALHVKPMQVLVLLEKAGLIEFESPGNSVLDYKFTEMGDKVGYRMKTRWHCPFWTKRALDLTRKHVDDLEQPTCDQCRSLNQ